MPDLPCPKCLEVNCVSIDLADGDTITCSSCNDEFYVDDVRKLVAGWGPLIAWLDAHPARRPEPVAAE